MARPFSNDLRERVVDAVTGEGLSCRAAAKRFGIGISTAIDWVRRFRETGSAAPGQMGGHKPRKLSGPHRAWLLCRCRERDFTLHGLVAEFERARPEGGLSRRLDLRARRGVEL